MVTRSSTAYFLIGHPEETFGGARLPSKGEVLRVFMFSHLIDKKVVRESARVTADKLLLFWQKSGIPTIRVDKVVTKIVKTFQEYRNIKRSRTKSQLSYKMKEELFKADLEDLFDVSHQDALHLIKNKEDAAFLCSQRDDRQSSSMGPVDVKMANMIKRKVQANERKRKFKEKDDLRRQEAEATMIMNSSSSSEEDENPDTKFSCSAKPKKRCKVNVITPNVCASLDRTNISSRKGMHQIASTCQGLGLSADEVTLSASTIRRRRIAHRKSCAEEIKRKFTETVGTKPLTLHWDGKLLPDITQWKAKTDRVAILVTGDNIERLLSVAKVQQGTGKQIADSCIEVVSHWKIKDNIKCLCFDTTAANTGVVKGACTLIESELERELLWLPCRHHIYEVVLAGVPIAAGRSSCSNKHHV